MNGLDTSDFFGWWYMYLYPLSELLKIGFFYNLARFHKHAWGWIIVWSALMLAYGAALRYDYEQGGALLYGLMVFIMSITGYMFWRNTTSEGVNLPTENEQNDVLDIAYLEQTGRIILLRTLSFNTFVGVMVLAAFLAFGLMGMDGVFVMVQGMPGYVVWGLIVSYAVQGVLPVVLGTFIGHYIDAWRIAMVAQIIMASGPLLYITQGSIDYTSGILVAAAGINAVLCYDGQKRWVAYQNRRKI